MPGQQSCPRGVGQPKKVASGQVRRDRPADIRAEPDPCWSNGFVANVPEAAIRGLVRMRVTDR
jgi:hypothetical protein